MKQKDLRLRKKGWRLPSSDLLVTTERGEKTISLQVKTAKKSFNPSKKYGDYLAWAMPSKAVTVSDTHWYAFVDIKNWPEDDKTPEVFLVPSAKVKSVFETENKPNAKWFFFILYLREADQYKGQTGRNSLLKELLRAP